MLIVQNGLIILEMKLVNSDVVPAPFGMITSWANGHQLYEWETESHVRQWGVRTSLTYRPQIYRGGKLLQHERFV